MLACESDNTGADAVLSRRRLRNVDTMETVVVLNVDQLSSGYGTPVALSSGSEPSPKPGRSVES